RCRGLCARSEWRPNRDRRRPDTVSSRPDRQAGGPPQAARGLLRSCLRRLRRPDLLWAWFRRSVPARRRLRRPRPEGREAGRPARASTDEVRVGDHPKDREGARLSLAAVADGPRGGGDGMMGGELKMNLPRRKFLHLAAGAAALPAVSRIAWAQA